MQSYEDTLQSALENAIARERTARRRSILYTLIPAIMTAILIGVTWWQVSTAIEQLNSTKQDLDATRAELQNANIQISQAEGQFEVVQNKLEQTQKDVTDLTVQLEQYKQETEQLRAERDALQKEIGDLRKTIDDLGNQVNEAQGLKRYLYQGNLTLGFKELPDTPQSRLLLEILDMQPGSQAKWRLGGSGPDEFDSPGFAVYMLNQYRAIRGDNRENHYSLPSILPPTNTPTNGDIVIYEKGYTMFYYFDGYASQPYVIGMTPLGIVALKYDFAPIRMIGHVTYP